MNEMIMVLNLSVLFVFSVLTINLIGIIICEYIKTKNLIIKKLQRNFIYLFILLEIAFISGFLRYTLDEKSYVLKFNLAIAVIAFSFFLFILFCFWKFLDKKITLLNLSFGGVTVIGVVGNLFFDNVIIHSIHLIGLFGLIIFAPLLVIKLLIDNTGKRHRSVYPKLRSEGAK